MSSGDEKVKGDTAVTVSSPHKGSLVRSIHLSLLPVFVLLLVISLQMAVHAFTQEVLIIAVALLLHTGHCLDEALGPERVFPHLSSRSLLYDFLGSLLLPSTLLIPFDIARRFGISISIYGMREDLLLFIIVAMTAAGVIYLGQLWVSAREQRDIRYANLSGSNTTSAGKSGASENILAMDPGPLMRRPVTGALIAEVVLALLSLFLGMMVLFKFRFGLLFVGGLILTMMIFFAERYQDVGRLVYFFCVLLTEHELRTREEGRSSMHF